MQLSPEEFMKLQAPMSQKDIEIAMLRQEVELLRNQIGEPANEQPSSSVITLSLDKVCQVLKELRGNPNLVSFLFLAIQKMMPEGMSNGAAVQRMMAAASLESLPLNITPQGDLNIGGNYNNVHDNDNVSL